MKIFSLNPILNYENKEAERMPDLNQFQSGSDESRSMCKKRTDAITQSKCPTDFHASPLCCTLFHCTLPTAEIVSGKNARAFLVCGFLMKSLKKNILKISKKSWERFGSYLQNSTANPAHSHPNWAGLAVLFRRQLLNGFQDFFCFNILILIYFFKYKTIETHARAFLPLNISAVCSVYKVHIF